MQTEVISFYSDIDGKTYYSDHAKRLTEQLIRFNVPHDIREKPSLGTYQKNCLSKPAFIYQFGTLIDKEDGPRYVHPAATDDVIVYLKVNLLP